LHIPAAGASAALVAMAALVATAVVLGPSIPFLTMIAKREASIPNIKIRRPIITRPEVAVQEVVEAVAQVGQIVRA
jgi:hypothetical protein